MEIKTKFNLGDKLWVISDSKAAEIEVGVIQLSSKGASYGANRYDLHLESECFATKEELLKYVAGE